MIRLFMRSRNLLLVLALGLLLVSQLDELEAVWRQPLFLAHLGASLLWQPLVSGSRRVNARDALVIAGAAFVVTIFLNPWVMLIWTALLAALVGGRVFDFAPRAERWLNLGALTFLVAFMFALVLPDLLPAPMRAAALTPAIRGWIEMALISAVGVMFVAALRISPGGTQSRWPAGVYDPVHSIWMLLLLLLLSFFGIALMTLTELGYMASIGITFISVAALLIAVEFLWGRVSGTAEGRGSLALLFSRYLLSFGIPYEIWLERLAVISREEGDPERFFDLAIRALAQLTVLEGARWGGAMPAGGFGAGTGAHLETFVIPVRADSSDAVQVSLVTRKRLSPAFVWHIKLLIQIAVQFYAAKAREKRLGVAHYLRAVHETGARVTHDVKNLLQSLDGVIAAAGTLDDDRQVRQLVDRQLPEIGRRLAQTLNKLQQPSAERQGVVRVCDWWAGLVVQYGSQPIQFDASAMQGEIRIAHALFTSAADNLLQNALLKGKSEPGIAIRVAIVARDERVEFSVEDTGSAIPEAIRRQLFFAPVPSRTGLGLGLYQVARQADAAGMALVLASNQPGCVRFVLGKRGATGTAWPGPPAPSAVSVPIA